MSIRFVWQGFASGGATVRISQQLHPCPTEPTSAKAEPSSNGATASGKTDLRRGKRTWPVKKEEEEAPPDAGGIRLPDVGTEIPLKPVVQTDHGEAAVPLKP